MKLLTRLVSLVELVATAILVPATRAVAFALRRGRYSGWQRAQRRAAR